MDSTELSKLLADNLSYYVNGEINRRCKIDKGCKYSGISLGLNTDGCFIGRLLSPETRIILDNGKFGYSDIGSIVNISKYKCFNIDLPDYVVNNHQVFAKFQQLHDKDSNWESNGYDLSKRGIEELKSILDRFDTILCKEDFEKFLK